MLRHEGLKLKKIPNGITVSIVNLTAVYPFEQDVFGLEITMNKLIATQHFQALKYRVGKLLNQKLRKPLELVSFDNL